eukprot:362505-Chlamydomonas_euryale.AAC.1
MCCKQLPGSQAGEGGGKVEEGQGYCVKMCCKQLPGSQAGEGGGKIEEGQGHCVKMCCKQLPGNLGEVQSEGERKMKGSSCERLTGSQGNCGSHGRYNKHRGACIRPKMHGGACMHTEKHGRPYGLAPVNAAARCHPPISRPFTRWASPPPPFASRAAPHGNQCAPRGRPIAWADEGWVRWGGVRAGDGTRAAENARARPSHTSAAAGGPAGVGLEGAQEVSLRSLAWGGAPRASRGVGASRSDIP